MEAYPKLGSGHVRVMAGIRQVFESDKATQIEFRDSFGDLMAIFCRHFNDDMWILVTKDDPDWESHLVRLGLLGSSMNSRSLIKELKDKR